MKGVIDVIAIKTKYGTYTIRIECRDRSSVEKLIRKLRLIGVFTTVIKNEE